MEPFLIDLLNETQVTSCIIDLWEYQQRYASIHRPECNNWVNKCFKLLRNISSDSMNFAASFYLIMFDKCILFW